MKKFLIIGSVALLALSACDKTEPTPNGAHYHTYHFTPSNTQAEIQTALINMNNRDTVHFGAGTYNFTSTLSITDKDSIVIKGDGCAATILNFGNQTVGAQGLNVQDVDWFMIRDLQILDPLGDGIKVKNGHGVTFKDICTYYTGVADSTNGAYGIYPVESNNVRVDGCRVSNVSDAGIYVGQSRDVIVTNCHAEGCVLGIEIENCLRADVYNNTCTNNSGGIAIFNLPGLPIIKNGSICRVYNNTCTNNNLKNFARSGNIVGTVPTGTGVMVLAYDHVEVFNNTLTNNQIMGLGVISYNVITLFGGSMPSDPLYNMFSKDVIAHGNTFTRNSTVPADRNNTANFIYSTVYGNDINAIDDIFVVNTDDPDTTDDDTPTGLLCLRANTGASFGRLDPLSQALDQNMAPYDNCTKTGLTNAIVVAPQ